MNPFLDYIMSLIQQLGFQNAGSSMFNPMVQDQQFMQPAFNPMDYLGANSGVSPFQRLNIQPNMPMPPIGQGSRTVGSVAPNPFAQFAPRTVAQSFPVFQPTGEPPIINPSPRPIFAPTNEAPIERPSPYQTPPIIPPIGNSPFEIEPMPGMKIPVNMSGIFGQGQNPMAIGRTNPLLLSGIGRTLYR